METHIMSSQRLKCPIVSVPKFKAENPNEENGSEVISLCEDQKDVDLCLNYNGEENGTYEFTPIVKIKNEKEMLDQKDSNLHFEELSSIKCKTETFKKMQLKSNDRNIDKVLDIDNDIKEPCAIKKEAATDELNWSHDSPFKSEFIKQEELHIKDEEDIKDGPSEKIPKLAALHQCPECPYNTICKYRLKAHSVKHKRGNEIDWYSCQECSYKTCRKQNIKRHVEIHNTSNLILKCSKCSYVTSRSTKFKKHQIEHKPNIRWLHCPKCSFKTHLTSYFRKHSLKHKSNTFKCPNCPYQTGRKDSLAIHQVKHESRDKWHSCPLCSFKTHAKKMLQVHCRGRHKIDPDNPKKTVLFKCTECPYETGYKGNMGRHQVIHNRNSQLQCPNCAFRTPHKHIFKKHEAQHQCENGETWHRCLDCPFKTMYNHNLRKHIMSHKSADEIQWFVCSQCSYKTAYKQHLKRHQLKHKEAQEVEWFSCYECSFKTKLKGSLVRHVSKHKTQIDR